MRKTSKNYVHIYTMLPSLKTLSRPLPARNKKNALIFLERYANLKYFD